MIVLFFLTHTNNKIKEVLGKNKNALITPHTQTRQACIHAWCAHYLRQARALLELCRVASFDVGNHLEHGFGKRNVWMIISSWIIFGLGNTNRFENAVLNVHCRPLGTVEETLAVRAWVVELNIKFERQI